jgi:hypothetical protein
MPAGSNYLESDMNSVDRSLFEKISNFNKKSTKISDKETFNSEVLKFFGIFKRDIYLSTDVVVGCIDGKLDLLALVRFHFKILLIFFRIKFDINLN